MEIQDENKPQLSTTKLILAFVGMPGSGKSEASSYLQKTGVPFIRFGQQTDEGLQAQGLRINPENERTYREGIRKELGMAAYAIKAKPKIEQLLKENDFIAIDGLYSWEEYVYLKKDFPNLILVTVYTEPEKRYERLATRPIRPISKKEARERDITEIEKLNKAGPIAIADYLIDNNGDLDNLHKQIDTLLQRLKVRLPNDSH